MILPLLMAAAEPAKTPGIEEQRFSECVALVDNDAEAAIRKAESWRLSGGGLDSRLCLGLAYAEQQRWSAARMTFETAAKEAERAKDKRAADFWVQAANAALAAGDWLPARNALDAALALADLQGAELGEAHLDRARAHFALKDVAAARLDLDAAIKLVPADPLVWLLSATLARRTGDLALAEQHVKEAANRSPDDPSIALEAGNIAAMLGAPNAAKLAWQAAVKNGPDTSSGKAAAEALKQFSPEPSTPPEKADPAPAAAPR